MTIAIDSARLMAGLEELGTTGRDEAGRLCRIAPVAMIFVPSKDGISHSPAEFTAESNLIAGANVLLDTVRQLVQ